MARALATIINVVDPDVIVLGGGMSNLARLYTRVPGGGREYVFSDRVDTRLVPPRHGRRQRRARRGLAVVPGRGDALESEA